MMQPMPSAVADHGYRCPKCDAPMLTFQRSSVTVERCSECRGIFLDRGELERLLDMEAGGPMRRSAAPRDDRSWRAAHDDDDDDVDDGRRQQRRGRRRGGFLEELLDALGD
jgi:Zn-finger nucleic acid-binding protein